MGFDYLNPRESPTGREFLGGGRFGESGISLLGAQVHNKESSIFAVQKSCHFSRVPRVKTKIKRSEELERFSVQGRGLIHFFCESPSFPLKIPSLSPLPLV